MRKTIFALTLFALLPAQSLFAAASTLREKMNVAYVNIANAVASESPSTPLHEQRMKIARQCATLNPPFDAFLTIDLTLGQDYGDSTPQATIQNRMIADVLNLIALGFGD